MTRFNIYITAADAAKIMCMFHRDRGLDTPEDTSQARTYKVAVRPLRLIDTYPENPEVDLVADMNSVMDWQ